MQISKNKTNAALIALFLMLTVTVTSVFVALPSVNAHTPAWTIPTWCYVAITNNVIGVGQQDVIVFWVNSPPPTAQGAYGDRWTFYIDIMKPDGKNDTLGPITSDPVGGGYVSYTPDQTGTYTIVARFPGDLITGLPLNPAGGQTLTNVNDTYAASTSAPVTFNVQQEPIQGWQEPPLPTEYWTFPINNVNRGWNVLIGNWLAGAAQNVGPTLRFCYGKGPESAHVMWAVPMWAGGIMDERFGDMGYETGHYEGLSFTPPIILNGHIYYNTQSLPREGWYCLDLYTGKTEYFFNTTGPVTGVSQSSSGSINQQSLAFGQILDVENPNQHGGMPYLWSTTAASANTWMMYDAFTGNYMCSIANVSSAGTAVYGKDGSILRYNIVNYGTTANPSYYLTVWNTTQSIWWRGTSATYQKRDYSAFLANDYWMWRPGLNITYDGNNGFSLNASIPAVQGSILAVREGQYVIGGTSGKNNGTYILPGNLWALNLKPDDNGIITPTLLWNITFTPPQAPPDVAVGSYAGIGGFKVDPEDGVFIFCSKQTQQRWGYSLATGLPLWGPTASEPAMNFYSMDYDMFGVSTYIYQGMLLSPGYGGVLIAYNITTGQVLWNYTATQVGFESPYGNYPVNIAAIADGKLYLITGEHSPTQPMWRGGNLRCVNASNGAELWKILQFGADGAANLAGINVAMGDGYVVGLNLYDNQIYCYGKGPSATTVTAPDTAVPLGSSLMIRGTVTDQCAGAQALAAKMGFANGVPALSDASQEAWMEYLYEQQAKPTNATGVLVTIDVIDPNGNYVNIGDVTSDESGFFSLGVNTNILGAGPGEYTVIASFAGSNSYGPSNAESSFTINATATPASTAAPLSNIATTTDLILDIVAVGIAIIIAIAIATVLILRKRP